DHINEITLNNYTIDTITSVDLPYIGPAKALKLSYHQDGSILIARDYKEVFKNIGGLTRNTLKTIDEKLYNKIKMKG
ncbi:hypothetical protein LCGC14_2971070, partial [marine sediment metagenome]